MKDWKKDERTANISGTAITSVVRGDAFLVKIKIYLQIKDNFPREEFLLSQRRKLLKDYNLFWKP